MMARIFYISFTILVITILAFPTLIAYLYTDFSPLILMIAVIDLGVMGTSYLLCRETDIYNIFK